MKKLEITNMHGETIGSLRSKRNRLDAGKAKMKIVTIIMCIKGKSAREISRTLELDVETVCTYIKKFVSGGIEELLDYKKSPGRPAILSEQEEELVKELVQLTPEETGIGIEVNWTAGLVKKMIYDTFGKEMSLSGVNAMLHRLGFSHTRPTYVLAKADKKNY